MQFASSSYGPAPQNNFNSTGQYQPVPQIQPPAGSSSQSITPGTAPQSNGEQPTVTTVMLSVRVLLIFDFTRILCFNSAGILCSLNLFISGYNHPATPCQG